MSTHDRLREYIRARRRAMGHSQEAMAKRMGVHANTLRGWELGRRSPQVSQLDAIAASVGHASAGELFEALDDWEEI